jgi:uncharacterized protein (TIGR02266 family)
MAVLSPSSNAQLLVHCETWLDFIEHYASDLRKGGLFVATDAPPPVLTALDVRLQLPEATELVLRARVVQVLSDEQARSVGKARGVGLELTDLDAERKRQIAQLLEFARWQGEQNDPNASFTRMLLEMSPSLPPAEVGYRLSMLPGAAPRSADKPSPTRRAASGPIAMPRASDAARSLEPGSHQRLKATTATPTSPPPAAEETARASRAPGAGRASQAPASQLPAADRASHTDKPMAADKAAATDKAQAPAVPPKPSDPILLKRLLSEVAHKHYEAALRTAREMLEGNPGDPQAQRWLHMCDARIARARNDDAAAAEHYALALPFDEDNREAREFVRNHRRDRKLNSIPFGRYFTKKK